MCFPNDPDELLCIARMKQPLDTAEQTPPKMGPERRRCESCGRIKPDMCSLCGDELRAAKLLG